MCPEKGCAGVEGGEYDIGSLEGPVGGVGNGISGSKVVSVVADGGRVMSLDEVPICLSGGYADSLEEGRAYGDM
jgi:hypothetical protein